MAVSEVVSVEAGLTRPAVHARVHPLRVVAAAVVLLALLLEVTASLAARRTQGAPQFRTYSTPTTVPVKDPRC